MEALSRVGLYLKPEKCEFNKTEVKYLGLIISADGVKMDPKKVKAWWSGVRQKTFMIPGIFEFLQVVHFRLLRNSLPND